jgi:hypothetical protein
MRIANQVPTQRSSNRKTKDNKKSKVAWCSSAIEKKMKDKMRRTCVKNLAAGGKVETGLSYQAEGALRFFPFLLVASPEVATPFAFECPFTTALLVTFGVGRDVVSSFEEVAAGVAVVVSAF